MTNHETEKPKFRINIHLIIGIIFLIILCLIIFKATNWGQMVSLEDFFDRDETVSLKDYALDQFFPALSKDDLVDDGELQILFLGNNNLVADYGTSDNLTSIIAQQLDATIYNCGIENTYIASEYESYQSSAPNDAFNLYGLTTYFTKNDKTNLTDALASTDYSASENTLTSLTLLDSIDFEKIDVITIFYDAADYYAGRKVIAPDGTVDITYFASALDASINLIREAYPHIRVIVLSPTYSYAVTDEGEYISSNHLYINSPFSSYIYAQADFTSLSGTTFIDNYFGTINEEMAADYLIDESLLNVAGRELVATRFLEGLEYFD